MSGAMVIGRIYARLLRERAERELSEQGELSCTEPYAEGSRKPAKSSARSCGAMHDCAVHPSDEPARGSGRTKRRKSLRLALAAQYGRPPTRSLETESHPADQSQPSSPKLA